MTKGDRSPALLAKGERSASEPDIAKHLQAGTGGKLAAAALKKLKDWDYDALRRFCDDLVAQANAKDALREPAIATLTALIDTPCHTGAKKRSSVLQILHIALHEIFNALPPIESTVKSTYKRIAWKNRKKLRKPAKGEKTLVIDADGFEPELEDRDSKLMVDGFRLGWKNFIAYNLVGQRFHGVGLGPDSTGVRIDLYDSSGDYEASGIDGLEMHIHGNAQDQLGQIMKAGKLVVHGDVGQTFMYGAKGGEVYIRGNAAGRPLINAVGKPRVVINGTCLDYLAESFMAGNPLAGRRLRDPQRPAVRRLRRLQPAQAPLPGEQPLLAGVRRRDLHPRPRAQDRRRAAQRRPLPPAGRRRLGADQALPRREREALRHQARRPADPQRQEAQAGRRSSARSAR